MTRGAMERVATTNGMLRTQRVRRAQAHLVQRTLDVAIQLVGLTKSGQSTKRSFAVGSRRVNQNTGHGFAVCRNG